MATKRSKGVWALIAVAFMVLILGVGYVLQVTLFQKPAKLVETNDTYVANQDINQIENPIKPSIPDDAWNMYVNEKYGFSLKVPKTMYHHMGSECEWRGDSYRPRGGLVPVKAFEGDGVVYISSEYFYDLSGETEEDGYHFYSECNKIINSLGALREEEYWQQQNWEFVIEDIANDDELDVFLKERYGKGCYLEGKEPSAQEGVFDILIGGDGRALDETECPINYVTKIKYYPAKNKVISWHLGHVVTFSADEGYGAVYDGEMVNSFRFK